MCAPCETVVPIKIARTLCLLFSLLPPPRRPHRRQPLIRRLSLRIGLRRLQLDRHGVIHIDAFVCGFFHPAQSGDWFCHALGGRGSAGEVALHGIQRRKNAGSLAQAGSSAVHSSTSIRGASALLGVAQRTPEEGARVSCSPPAILLHGGLTSGVTPVGLLLFLTSGFGR